LPAVGGRTNARRAVRGGPEVERLSLDDTAVIYHSVGQRDDKRKAMHSILDGSRGLRKQQCCKTLAPVLADGFAP